MRGRVSRALVAAAVLGLAATAARVAGSDEPSAQEDLLGGFEEEAEPPAEETEETEPEEPEVPFWDLTGSIALGTSLNYLDHRAPGRNFETGDTVSYLGFSRLRTRLALQLDLDLPREWNLRIAGFGFYDWIYLARGRDKYTKRVLDRYEWEADFSEVWVEGNLLENLDLKLGRQIVNWGRSDSIRILDVLNPLDNREPGRVDIEFLRRPLTMAKLSYYWREWSLTGIAIPEIRFDRNPVFGNDFFPSTPPPPRIGRSSWRIDNTEWAGSLLGIFQGWDVSLHAARYFDDRAHSVPSARVPAGVVRKHSRLTLAGAGGNYTLGSWLFKAEFAWIDGLGFFHSKEKSRFDSLLGVEYYGFTDTTIAVEVANRHIHNFDRATRNPPDFARQDRWETAIRYTADFLNARLHVTLLGIIFGEKAQDGSFVRLSADYDIRDALVLSGGILLFQDGDDPPLDVIADNDRLFAELKYSF